MEKLRSQEDDNQLNNEKILSPEVQLPETFEDVKSIVDAQAERITAKVNEKGYDGLLSRLSTSGRKFAGAALLSLSSFAAGCSKTEGGRDFNSYNVAPEVFAQIKGVQEKYESKYQEAKSKYPNGPIKRIEFALDQKEKREIRSIIRHSEKAKKNTIPSSIKQEDGGVKEESANLQEEEMAENLINNAKEMLERNSSEGIKVGTEKTMVETEKDVIEETPEQRLNRRIKEIREIKTAPPRENRAQKLEKIMKESKEIEIIAPGEIHNPTKLEILIEEDQKLAAVEKDIKRKIKEKEERYRARRAAVAAKEAAALELLKKQVEKIKN